MKIKNADGTEVEVMSPEEVQKKLDEVAEAAKNERKNLEDSHSQKIATIEEKMGKLEQDKKDLEEKLNGGAGAGDDHPNFKVLKEALDKKETEIKALTESMQAINKQRVDDFLKVEIKKAAGNDEEVAKKIKHHFDETLKAMPDKTSDDIAARIDAAKRLAGVADMPNPMDFSGQGGGFFPFKGGTPGAVELNDKEKDLGRKMGLTDDDYKKYGNKLRKNYGQ